MRKPKPIDFFDGTAHDFLSNFHHCATVLYAGRAWPTTEHAFQAMKSVDPHYRTKVWKAKTPGAAKGLGQRASFRKNGWKLVPDWDAAKFRHMLELLRIKFAQPRMAEALLRTGEAELIEGNTWDDTCWGVCRGVGTNHLGRQLMRVRAEIRSQVRELWHVTGIGTGGTYLRTVECRTLLGVRRAATKLAAEVRAPLLSPGEVTAVFLAGRSDPRRIVGESGSYVEVEKVK